MRHSPLLRGIVPACFAAAAWTGCAGAGKGGAVEPAPAGGSIDARAEAYAFAIPSNDETYVVRFTPEPSPIPLNEPFTLDVAVAAGRGGAAPPDLRLGIDAVMPDHQHGMNTRPRVTALGSGRFRVEGMLFHMAGHWELYFDISEGAVTERAQHDVHLE